MSFISKVFTSLLAAAALSACSNLTISTDYDVNHDFSAYTTYQWHPSGPPQTDDLNNMGSDIFDRRITRLTEQKLAAKGITKGDTPQFYINYSVVTEERVSMSTYNSGFGAGYHNNNFYGGGGVGGGGGFSDTRVRYYIQGTVVIDIIDANKNLLVWRSSSASRLKSDLTPQQNEADMSVILDQILADFPPQ
ncbi:MAG: hypothetical protein ACJAQS_000984 [Porticoccus sp.]